MWPWEHAIVGYLAYSLFAHLYYRASPNGLEAFAVVFASVLPDLIDKPLAWEYGVFETGYALGHSIFFAVPLSIAVGLLARRVGRGRAGVAFGVGYLLHLPADVLDTYVRGGQLAFNVMLWPVDPIEPGHGHEHTDFLGEFTRLFGRYSQELLAGELSTYMWIQTGLAGLAVLVWLADGAPVLREFLRGFVRVVSPS
ncbi:metal-dependent hydrolase [Salinadaptatus halalkaliphilus]|uniref:Metal-dependent hydrolase n=1 Tax=Salinadaptatus halalkaliphilus TaxID=2419781 RepID=A0A4S3TGB2_9EURY|nr:metal-dependent hydrolase [Salinadaptatus halalkaliphilus]THE62896.1 metal-dependent hydrolase [Salinadaptatus halalkaliphilus]